MFCLKNLIFSIVVMVHDHSAKICYVTSSAKRHTRCTQYKFIGVLLNVYFFDIKLVIHAHYRSIVDHNSISIKKKTFLKFGEKSRLCNEIVWTPKD